MGHVRGRRTINVTQAYKWKGYRRQGVVRSSKICTVPYGIQISSKHEEKVIPHKFCLSRFNDTCESTLSAFLAPKESFLLMQGSVS